MEAALPLFAMLGAVIIISAVLLILLFTIGRSHGEHQTDKTSPAAAPPHPESISVCLEPGGTVSIEIEGRSFARMQDIAEERLINRVLAAAAGLQQFIGIAPQPQLTQVELTDALRAGHAPSDGSLVVEFRGQRYRQLTDIPDGETGRQVLSLISELMTFAKGLAQPTASRPPTPPTTDEHPPTEAELLRQLTAPSVPKAPPKMPSLIEALRRPPPRPTPMPVGLAGQIDRVLQEQLATNAALLERDIHVTTARDGSLIVEVNGQPFDWPDGVTDPVIREAVQKAIRTWEKS